ncbi:MAG TPA: DUF2500 domain-containing protein [Actinomycetales bacterium]
MPSDPPVDLFTVVPILIGVVFVIVLSAFVVAAVRGAVHWRRNNASAVVTGPATVVGRRAHTSGGSGDTSATTRYFVTFERQDGSRLELRLRADRYALIAERDRGLLTSQGTRFKGFER